MQEDYVSFKQAKQLKELGFPQDTSLTDYGWSCWGGSDRENIKVYQVKECDLTCIAPTLSMVQKWLREEEELYIGIITDTNKEKWKYGRNFKYDILYCGTDSTANIFSDDIKFDKYEEALSAGIDKCIEILKEK